MNELTLKPARTVPNWQVPTSTGLEVRPAIEAYVISIYYCMTICIGTSPRGRRDWVRTDSTWVG